jgi:hypothetical protein
MMRKLVATGQNVTGSLPDEVTGFGIDLILPAGLRAWAYLFTNIR